MACSLVHINNLYKYYATYITYYLLIILYITMKVV